MEYNYEFYKKPADYVLNKLGFAPDIAMILGSGLGGFSNHIENAIEISYSEIPNFLKCTANDHAGKLICGTVMGKRVVCMSGRFHSYEGYDFEQLALPVRFFKCLGAKATIITNAAGAINTEYNVGDIMLIKDHIKLTGDSPMRGKNIAEFGKRFFDISKMYTPHLRELAKECAKASELTVHEGVYFFFTGPQFETPAEIKAARILGGDAAGMSTVTEALTAAHCNMPLLGISVMTNMAAGVLDIPLSGDDVNETAERVGPLFCEYVKNIISRIDLSAQEA